MSVPWGESAGFGPCLGLQQGFTLSGLPTGDSRDRAAGGDGVRGHPFLGDTGGPRGTSAMARGRARPRGGRAAGTAPALPTKITLCEWPGSSRVA